MALQAAASARAGTRADEVHLEGLAPPRPAGCYVAIADSSALLLFVIVLEELLGASTKAERAQALAGGPGRGGAGRPAETMLPIITSVAAGDRSVVPRGAAGGRGGREPRWRSNSVGRCPKGGTAELATASQTPSKDLPYEKKN